MDSDGQRAATGRSDPTRSSEVWGSEGGLLSLEVSGTSSELNGGAGPVPSQQPARAGSSDSGFLYTVPLGPVPSACLCPVSGRGTQTLRGSLGGGLYPWTRP